MRAINRILILIIINICLFSPLSYGVSQKISLHAGWNAVYLEVDPLDDDWASILSGYPLESIYAWNPRIPEVDEIADPDQINAKIANLNEVSPKWLHFLPDENELLFLKNLHRAEGGRAYLIKLGITGDFEIDVEGTPVLPDIHWKENQFNFVGFHIDPENPPAFRDFFDKSAAHKDQMVFRLQTNGNWAAVDLSDPAETTLMKNGEAFWIYCEGESNFTGSLAISPEFGSSLDFGDRLHELTLNVKNLGSQVAMAEVSGTFPLYYQNEMLHWYSFSGSKQIAGVGDSSEGMLTVGIKRHEIPVGSPKLEAALKISNNEMRIYVPMIVEEGPGTSGLWIGNATINQVSSALPGVEQQVPKDTASIFDFRLILHMNQHTETYLLKEVIQMWKKEVTDPGDPNVILEPAKMVLMTNNHVPDNSYYGANLSNGKMAPARIDSAVFGFKGKRQMSGSLEPGGLLTIEYTIPTDDPLNPFHHMTHPDHKSFLNPDDEYNIVRKITLRLSDIDSGQLTWGETMISGEYEEEIIGLFRVGDSLNGSIRVKGNFTLYRVSTVTELLD